MAGIIAVYGLVVSVLIIGSVSPDQPYSLYAGAIHLAAGLSCGLTGLAAGHAIGITGDAVSTIVGVGREREGTDEGSSVRTSVHVPKSYLCLHGSHPRAYPLVSSHQMCILTVC